MTDGRPGAVAPTARQRQAEATRARILETALRLFAAQGYAATPTRQIAQEAGVSEGLVFRYFPAKIDLLRRHADRRGPFAAEVLAVLDEAGGQPVAEMLTAIMDGFVRLMEAERATLRMVIGESRTNAEMHATFRGIMDDTMDAVAAQLRARVADGELRADLPTATAARTLFGPLLLFLLTADDDDATAWRRRAATYADEVVDVWLRGARPGGPGPA